MIGSGVSRRSTRLGLMIGCLAVSSLGVVPAASAKSAANPPPGTQFSNVKIIAVGGNAVALANCINTAKAKKQVQQVSQCENAPIAAGGGVQLQGVNVLVQQPSGRVQRLTNVNITAKGGDATAVANCANAAKAGSVTQVNICTNAPTAVGGTVVLTDVNVTVGKVA